MPQMNTIISTFLGSSTPKSINEPSGVPRSHQWSFIEAEIRRILLGSKSSKIPPDAELSNPEVAKWIRILALLYGRLGRLSGGNKVFVCDNGDVAAREMLSAIDSATERVLMEVYIFDDSPLAARFVTALKNAAKRGCKVTLIIDDVGSLSFPILYHNELYKAGVEVLKFNPIANRKLAVGSLPFRNHKKVLVVDNHTAFCGSMNISKESTSHNMGGNGRFYDVNICLHGPVVCDLSDVVKRTLAMSSYKLDDIGQCLRADPVEGGVIVQVLESDMSRVTRRNDIQSSIATILSNAEHNIYLTTSYFYPPGFLRRSLLAVKRRDVEIRMLLSGNSDIPGDINATLHVLRKFFRKRAQQTTNNFRVFMTTKEHCHSKYVVVDDVWSSVGSFNWDRWSSRRNLEVSVGIFDPETATKLKNLQRYKENQSVEYTRSQSLNRSMPLKIFDSLIHKLIRLSGRNCFDGLSNHGFKFRFKKAFIRTFIDDYAGELIAMSNMAGV
ncbi:Cardiolipin synthase B [Babesia sp. Xinjiang]|uniref:Cardiolipin synthase B n=1 Tax=Babesia sp. Xinjiang TaxID=462227 RepID=UPI000A22F7FB|nr:Cardiolipin synthase B [Babesia sp. Xinjiang]ORM41406.1 Cardiolipin synthase B [Babesia sp. Xinjiang]